ncbi:MAG: 50S ribosomal protein L11 methyltransferase [Chitinophagaceae bacterium]|nr:MAG: 50S ribosomal protein L11 methyltransferase [Chitinophagaceae bacterium]
MKRYQQYIFSTADNAQSEIISALLSVHDHVGIEENEGSLTVYFEEATGNDDIVRQVASDTGSTVQSSFVDDRNWNSLWESNFEPVTVDDFVSLRAHFHEAPVGVEHDIVITPKMSFGTGHHATTWSMISQMRGISFSGKRVFDFGTGTGVLAILAAKLGAAAVTAIDNDSWSIENAAENFQRNNISGITLLLADDATGDATYEVILANINKNVILANLRSLRSQLAPSGIVLLSGLLAEDEGDIMAAATAAGLQAEGKVIRSNWLCLKLSTV